MDPYHKLCFGLSALKAFNTHTLSKDSVIKYFGSFNHFNDIAFILGQLFTKGVKNITLVFGMQNDKIRR